jgi:hypothetical protein
LQLLVAEITPIGLALGFGSLWVADIDRKTIDRINPRTGRMVARPASRGDSDPARDRIRISLGPRRHRPRASHRPTPLNPVCRH